MGRKEIINLAKLFCLGILALFCLVFAKPASATYYPFNMNSTGNLGIGTTTAQSAFVVTSGNVGIGTWTAAGGNLIVNGGANVGIGSAWPGATLDVQGNIRASGTISGTITGAISGLTAGTIPQAASGTSLSNSVIVQSSSNIGIGIGSPGAPLEVNGAITADGSGNSYFSSGNLGIGSVAPGQMLDVQGTVRDLGEVLTSNVPSSTSNTLYNNSGALYFNGSAVGGVSSQWITNAGVGIGTYGNVGIGTTTPQGAFVVTNGNVGIGTWAPTGSLNTVGAYDSSTLAPLIVKNLDAYGGDYLQYSQIWQSNSGAVMAWMRNDGTLYLGGASGQLRATLFQAQAAGSVASPSIQLDTNAQNGFYLPATNSIGVVINNADAIRINSSGNVGIGTLNPQNALAVSGGLSVGAAYATIPTASGNIIFQGNLGIGTIAPVTAFANTGTAVLSVDGADILPGGMTIGTPGNTGFSGYLAAFSNPGGAAGQRNALLAKTGATDNLSYPLRVESGNGAVLSVSASGNVGIGTYVPAGSLDIKSSNNVLVESGNVGIGSAWPGKALDVQGTVRSTYFAMAGGAPSSGFVLTATDSSGDTTWSSTGSAGGWNVSGTNIYNANSGNVGINTTNGSNVGIGTSTPQGALVVTNGNVGIGTWAPAFPLSVSGDTYHNGNVGIGTTYIGGAGEGALTVMNGNVGIGTWVPIAPLTISQKVSTNPQIMLEDSNSSGSIYGAQISFTSNGSSVLTFQTNDIVDPAPEIDFDPGQSKQLYVTKSGNVGIGPIIVSSGFMYDSSQSGGFLTNNSGPTYTVGFAGAGNASHSWLNLGYSTSTTSLTNPVMSIVDTGNVGIGTTTPQGALVVTNGNVGIGTWAPAAQLQVSGQYSSMRYNNGSTGGSVTIDWNNGNVQAITLTSSITTLTINHPVAGGRYLLEIKQGGSGGYTIAWPGTIQWPSATAPVLTTTVGQTDIITLYCNGTNYAAFYGLNYTI